MFLSSMNVRVPESHGYPHISTVNHHFPNYTDNCRYQWVDSCFKNILVAVKRKKEQNNDFCIAFEKIQFSEDKRMSTNFIYKYIYSRSHVKFLKYNVLTINEHHCSQDFLWCQPNKILLYYTYCHSFSRWSKICNWYSARIQLAKHPN